MVTFDPTQPALVHDQINDRIVEWKPEWASTWPDRSAMRRAFASGTTCCSTDGSRCEGWPSRRAAG